MGHNFIIFVFTNFLILNDLYGTNSYIIIQARNLSIVFYFLLFSLTLIDLPNHISLYGHN